MNKVSFKSAVKPKSQCIDYIISRAFIPPWSLVTTKPETLGPDASSAERGRNPSFALLQLYFLRR